MQAGVHTAKPPAAARRAARHLTARSSRVLGPSASRRPRTAPTAAAAGGGGAAAPGALQASSPATAAAASSTSALEPYIITERLSVLTAVWDPRELSDGEYETLERQLTARGARSIEFHLVRCLSSPDQIQVTVTCEGGPRGKGVSDALAAVILQTTAATYVRVAEESRVGLPQKTVPVDTEWGPVRVHVSLKGAELFKATPDWGDCEIAASVAAGEPSEGEEAAAAAGGSGGGGGPDAEAVAAAALMGLHMGLEEGTISLGTEFLL